MIRYSSMTLGQAVDEVMLRLGQQRTAINLDSQTVQTFINRARREVLNKTLPYKDWAYVLNNIPIRHGNRLPLVEVGTFLNPDGWTVILDPLDIDGLTPIGDVLVREGENVISTGLAALLEVGKIYFLAVREGDRDSITFQVRLATAPGGHRVVNTEVTGLDVSTQTNPYFTPTVSGTMMVMGEWLSTNFQAGDIVSLYEVPEGAAPPGFAGTNPTQLVPLSWLFIKPIRCLLRPVGSAAEVEYEEARYVDPKEYFTMADWRSRQSWNSATSIYPTYTFWGAKNSITVGEDDNPDDNLYFYAAPNADQEGYMNWQTGTSPAGFSYAASNMEGFLDCYVGYPELYDMSSKLYIPYEFENLTIVYALMRCLAKIGSTERLQQYQQSSMEEQRRLREMFAASKVTMKRNLESLADVRGSRTQQQGGE